MGTANLRLTAVLPLLVLAAAPLRAAGPQDGGDTVVAKMGSLVLRLSDLRRVLDAQPAEVKRQLAGNPEALDRLARTEIFRRVLLDEARAGNWEQRPEVRARIDLARAQLVVSAYMNSLAQPPADYPGEDEIAALYEASQAELTVPRQVRLAQIYLEVPAAGEAAAVQRKAEGLARRAKEKGGDFTALARSNSAHQASAEKGGDMGWLAETEMIPELRAAVAAMAPGQVSDPIRSHSGWHVVKVAAVKPPAVRPLAEVRESLAALLRSRKARENERRHLDALAQKMPLTVNGIALELLAETGSRRGSQ